MCHPDPNPRRAPRMLTSTRKSDRLTANQAALSAEVGWTRPGPEVRGFRNRGRVLELSGSRRVLPVPRQFGSQVRGFPDLGEQVKILAASNAADWAAGTPHRHCGLH